MSAHREDAVVAGACAFVTWLFVIVFVLGLADGKLGAIRSAADVVGAVAFFLLLCLPALGLSIVAVRDWRRSP